MKMIIGLTLAALLSACENDAMKRGDEIAERYRREAELRATQDSLHRLEQRTRPAREELATNPCDRPRPYKSWSNEELNAAQVRYIGTPQSQGLIDEASCRLSGH